MKPNTNEIVKELRGVKFRSDGFIQPDVLEVIEQAANLIQSLQPRPIEEAPRDEPFLAFEGDNIYKCEFYNKDDDTGKIHYSAYCGQPVVESPQPETFIPLSAIQALGDGV